MTTATATQLAAQSFDSVFDCPRCSGKGYLDHFNHVASGRCFLCGGSKKVTLKERNNKGEYHCDHYVNHGHNQLCITWAETDGRVRSIVAKEITPQNRDEMANLWKAAKAAGVKCSQRDYKTNELIRKF